ncbi:MAG: hypothetical protein Q7S58_21890 [Candidatus Binatus sp.]|uniref:hypothetical protein n=1 Tax=Candidatus Binatus sp. TaxID=2811406 RepID=UPI00271FA4EB|nr:hypothetical protein [Candidatus Binatus sp.]MDO8435056.1 hypothetical protein [Candidatus Binatus sp.]
MSNFRITRAGRKPASNDRLTAEPPSPAPELTGIEERILSYYSTLRPRLREIGVATALAMVLTFVTTRFLMTHWYQARAVLRPASQEPQSSVTLGGLLGNITGGGGGGSGGVLNSLFGGSGASDANEFIATVTSVTFTKDLIQSNDLTKVLLRHVSPWSSPFLWLGISKPTPWKMYKLMTRRFNYDYHEQTGNLTLTFWDPEPEGAERVLNLYIAALRERLRTRYVQAASAAVVSLEQQIGKTSDALLVPQLDQLLAQQLQQLGTAKIQADFAFILIDPPAVPEHPQAPLTLVDTLLVGILAPLLASFWFLSRERFDSLVERMKQFEVELTEAHELDGGGPTRMTEDNNSHGTHINGS